MNPKKTHNQVTYEHVHQTLNKDLIAKILESNHYIYLNIERDYNKVIDNHNNLNNDIIKYKPIYLFYHNVKAL